MLRKNHFLLALVMSFSASAFAMVGGPFDNGDYSQLLDDTAIYQATFTMKNGLGFAQFGSNVSLGPSISASSGGGTQSQSNTNVGTVLDRSVIYFKGVTYFGMATGTVDTGRKKIMGITNGTTNATLNSATGAAATTGTANSGLSVTDSIVTNNGLGFTCNTEWSGTITESSNMLNFVGDGTITILTPDLSTQIYSAISGLVAAIPGAATSSGSSTTGGGGGGTTSVAQIVAAIQTLATLSTTPQIINAASPTADSVFQTTDTEDMHVSGTRKFFLSTR